MQAKQTTHARRGTAAMLRLLEDVGQRLGMKKPEDWYHIRLSDLRTRGLPATFSRRKLVDLLKLKYPNASWDYTRFSWSRWKSKAHLLNTLDVVERRLGIQQPQDWYSVTLADLREAGLAPALSRTKLAELLAEKHPDMKWERLFLLRGRFAQQRRLEKAMSTLFPDEAVIINARKEAGLLDATGEYLELDIYLPNLKLAFEYQERHHYISAQYTYRPLEEIQSRDAVKVTLAASKGITLITVPCWWNGAVESLVETIRKQRPELLTDVPTRGVAAIPEAMPPNFFDRHQYHVKDIGDVTTPCFFKLSDVDPTNWWLFEKYDGIRGFWHPHDRVFYSRQGKVIKIPENIVDQMPTDIFLDGEIWFGRDTFQEAIKIAQRVDTDMLKWDQFNYVVFDIPNHQGTYEDSYNLLVERVNKHIQMKGISFLRVAEKAVCTGLPHLEAFYQDIVNKGGEGIILRGPKSAYRPGRSPGYLKHKKFRDAEAKIVGPAGWHQWECLLPNGVKFIGVAGSTEFAEKIQPRPGDIVSFKHRGFLLATRKPKLPTLYRVRTDITWDDVVNTWREGKPAVSPEEKNLWRVKPTINKPKGYWENVDNCRLFFDDFAKEERFDSLSAEDWYSHWNALKKRKGVFAIVKCHKSLKRAMRLAYPELRFTEWQKVAAVDPSRTSTPTFSTWL